MNEEQLKNIKKLLEKSEKNTKKLKENLPKIIATIVNGLNMKVYVTKFLPKDSIYIGVGENFLENLSNKEVKFSK